MVGAVVVGEEENAVAYWERGLHGTKMPSSIRVMVSPLSAQEATQLLNDGKNLPQQVDSFCEAAHIKCGPDHPASMRRLLFFYYGEDDPASERQFHNSDDPASERQPHNDPDSERQLRFFHNSDDPASKRRLLFFYYGKDDPASERQLHNSDDPASERPLRLREATPLTISRKFRPAGPFQSTPSSVQKVGIVFREGEVLVTGQKISVEYANGRESVDNRAFLPRKLAALFPLTNGGSKITSLLGVPQEEVMETIHHCNAKSNGEVTECLTSLEDLVDFVSNITTSTAPIKVYDTFTSASSYKFAGKNFTVLKVKTLKQDLDEPSVTCHDVHVPFRTFYCHYTKHTKSFAVTLKDGDGSVHDRIAVCHYNTSHWNRDHIAFRRLHVKPGESEVCHWLGLTWMGQTGWLFLRG